MSEIARTLGYSRPTVRKYVEAAQRGGFSRGERRRGEAVWEQLAHETMESGKPTARGRPVVKEVAAYHDYLGER